MVGGLGRVFVAQPVPPLPGILIQGKGRRLASSRSRCAKWRLRLPAGIEWGTGARCRETWLRDRHRKRPVRRPAGGIGRPPR
ncbi:unnamed protein product [Ectocarpus sp. 6 AP-2014]